jgi:hypothetical protein
MKTKPTTRALEIPRKVTCGAGPVAGEKISGALLFGEAGIMRKKEAPETEASPEDGQGLE